jgi:hypothetical protein
MCVGLHVKYRYCCQSLIKLEFPRQIFEKLTNIKFHENPSRGSRFVPCGRTDRQTEGQTDRLTDMRKLIVAFRSFANAPKNHRPAVSMSRWKVHESKISPFLNHNMNKLTKSHRCDLSNLNFSRQGFYFCSRYQLLTQKEEKSIREMEF